MKDLSVKRRLQAICLIVGLSVGAIWPNGVQTASADISDVVGDVVDAVTPPDAVRDLKVSSAEVDAVTLAWSKVQGADTYQVSYWEPGKASSTTVGPVDVGNVSSYVAKGLKKETVYHFVVYSAKYLASSNKPTLSLKSASIETATAPGKLGVGDVEFSTTKSGYCSLNFKNLSGLYETEIRLYDYENNFLGSYRGDNLAASIKTDKIKENCFYSVRVSACHKNSDDSYTNGEWSENFYFATSMTTPKVSQKSGRISAKWVAVQGAQSYDVYISTKPSKGYKLVKTVNKLSASISKCGSARLKSKKTYYVKVKAQCMVDGSAYTVESGVKKIIMK